MTHLASYALTAQNSRGRQYQEPESATRSPFQRDRDRIIHSTAFRRLGHKTQVFVSPTGDHIRTRLTHSLEVAQIARSLARVLKVDEDLTEAIALSHDLGHPPFGHSGEDQLDADMKPYGGFDHNDQALRILTRLEQRYADFDGLNLTYETLEGVIKHNGPLSENQALPRTLEALSHKMNLRLSLQPSLEAQIAGIADDLAYNHHDLDDGLRAGVFDIETLLMAVPHVGQKHDDLLRQSMRPLPKPVLISTLVRELIGDAIMDVLTLSKENLARLGPHPSHEDIQNADGFMIEKSPTAKANERTLKGFLMQNFYRSPHVMKERDQGQRIIHTLFTYFLNAPNELPQDWRRKEHHKIYPSHNLTPLSQETALISCDYIAGMTDRFAKNFVMNIAPDSIL